MPASPADEGRKNVTGYRRHVAPVGSTLLSLIAILVWITLTINRHLLQCSYPRVSRISQLKVLRERLQALENVIATKDSGGFTQPQDMQMSAALITASSIQEIGLPQIYPIESRWYMPELLRFCKFGISFPLFPRNNLSHFTYR